MTQVEIPGFNLALTADSGQCFRFHQIENKHYSLIASGRQLEITDLDEGRFLFSCDEKEFHSIWHNYFDLGRDYAGIIAAAPREDAFLQDAIKFSGGLRILRQEAWETLISFIISQRKNIPAIKGCVEALSRRFGTELSADSYAFPSPQQLAEADIQELRACSLGYRAPYIQGTARMVASGAIDLEALHTLDDERLREILLRFPGVGVKVADCVMLFGYGRTAAFPRDVWINRALDRYYGGESPVSKLGPHAGILQQYIFCYIRTL